MTIPWLADVKYDAISMLDESGDEASIRVDVVHLLALIALAEAAERSLKLYDGHANAVIHEAVEAAEKVP